MHPPPSGKDLEKIFVVGFGKQETPIEDRLCLKLKVMLPRNLKVVANNLSYVVKPPIFRVIGQSTNVKGKNQYGLYV